MRNPRALALKKLIKWYKQRGLTEQVNYCILYATAFGWKI